MFGGGLTVPVPDLDRTDFLLILGANPYASNGSLATAPDWPGRLEAIKARGGRLVVVDPRRSRTAEEADLHLAIRPGTDAFLLAALVTTLAEEGLIDTGAITDHLAGLDEALAALGGFTPEAVADTVGVDAGVIRQLARDLAAAPSAAVYGRIGTTTAEFGTLTSWLVDLLNVCTGNLDRPGGAMFTRAAVGAANTRGKPQVGRGIRIGRHRSRVRGLSESLGELPAVCMAEEIDTPGEGQIRAMITIAGNPALSTPNAERLDAALAGLEFMVSVDIYRNETTRHADVILPAPTALQKGHYDIALLQLAIRNVANYSPPALPLEPGQLDEWEVMAKLALDPPGDGCRRGPCGGRRPDDQLAHQQRGRRRAFERARSRPRGAACCAEAAPRSRAPARLHAANRPVRRRLRHRRRRRTRTAPPASTSTCCWPTLMGSTSDRSSLACLRSSAHPRARSSSHPNRCSTTSPVWPRRSIDPVPISCSSAGGTCVPTTRGCTTSRSWSKASHAARCTSIRTMQRRLGLSDGADATVSSRTGSLQVPVELTDSIRPGVVSIPHGWGHDGDGVELGVARRHAGVNSNILADELLFDELSGTAVLNGIPVTVGRAPGM